ELWHPFAPTPRIGRADCPQSPATPVPGSNRFGESLSLLWLNEIYVLDKKEFPQRRKNRERFPAGARPPLIPTFSRFLDPGCPIGGAHRQNLLNRFGGERRMVRV